jgi:hypothetical protein
MKVKETYNGWKNRETWNVALWLSNEEYLYRLVMNYGKEVDYREFAITYLSYNSPCTPDGVNWLDDNLDYDALDELLEELG